MLPKLKKVSPLPRIDDSLDSSPNKLAQSPHYVFALNDRERPNDSSLGFIASPEEWMTQQLGHQQHGSTPAMAYKLSQSSFSGSDNQQTATALPEITINIDLNDYSAISKVPSPHHSSRTRESMLENLLYQSWNQNAPRKSRIMPHHAMGSKFINIRQVAVAASDISNTQNAISRASKAKKQIIQHFISQCHLLSSHLRAVSLQELPKSDLLYVFKRTLLSLAREFRSSGIAQEEKRLLQSQYDRWQRTTELATFIISEFARTQQQIEGITDLSKRFLQMPMVERLANRSYLERYLDRFGQSLVEFKARRDQSGEGSNLIAAMQYQEWLRRQIKQLEVFLATFPRKKLQQLVLINNQRDLVLAQRRLQSSRVPSLQKARVQHYINNTTEYQ